MRRFLLSLYAAAFAVGIAAAAPASAQQSLNLSIGGFVPLGLDGRGTDDVLFQNAAFLSTLNRDVGIDMSQFSGFTINGEWLVGLGPNFDAGLGVGFYQRTVPTVYTTLANANGSDIAQDLKLRVVPFSATIRWLPFGHDGPFQPYIGGGAGIYAWHYSETGQFVAPDNSIFVDSFSGSGSAVGPVILGGIRVPVGVMAVGGEIRYQGGEGNLPASEGFAGSKINLGGFNYLLVFNFKF
jgi:hypothetical protein